MLFPEIVYGPIHSRRLGISLGMELMPLQHKLCTFDCVYCECGFNQPVSHPVLPTRGEVRQALETKLQTLKAEGTTPDVITFSGNGEPTLHPDFLPIIQDTVSLRNTYFPAAKVSVLSNSTQLARPDVVEALRLCDNRILKLDSAIDETMRRIDQPVNNALTVSRIEQYLNQFDGLRPREIMIYVIDRATPVKTLEKLSRDEMEAIAAPLIAKGYKVIISA